MSTAVAEKTGVEKPAYEMPPVKLGQQVSWYPNYATRHDPHPAMVVKLGKTALTLRLMGLGDVGERSSVHHCDDPEVPHREHWHEFGVWDYTDEFKAEQREKKMQSEKFAALERRVAELESVINEPSAPKKTKQ